jgi:hypothetical protein
MMLGNVIVYVVPNSGGVRKLVADGAWVYEGALVVEVGARRHVFPLKDLAGWSLEPINDELIQEK